METGDDVVADLGSALALERLVHFPFRAGIKASYFEETRICLKPVIELLHKLLLVSPSAIGFKARTCHSDMSGEDKSKAIFGSHE